MTGTTHLRTLEAIANAQETLNAARFFPSAFTLCAQNGFFCCTVLSLGQTQNHVADTLEPVFSTHARRRTNESASLFKITDEVRSFTF